MKIPKRTCEKSEQADSPRFIPGRQLPSPASVSPQLRELLKRDHNNIDFPSTKEGWKRLITAWSEDPKWRQGFDDLIAKLGVIVARRQIGNVSFFEITPTELSSRNRNRLLVDLHAGGWLINGESAMNGAVIIAGLTGIPTIGVDYRTLPDHPYPAAIEDCAAVWRHVVGQTNPSNIGLTGSSAGAAMALSLIQHLAAASLPLPGALVCDSPLSDLSKTGDTYYTNEGIDNRIHRYDGLIERIATLYADGRKFQDPALSPIYGEFAGFPPTFLVSGTRDIFLSDTVRIQSKLMQAGVPTQLVIGEAMTHGIIQEAAMNEVPEGLMIYSYIAQFLDKYLSA